ncbi:MAG: ABC transporter ATP-binding protein [Pseudomonadota bacterium]
MTTSTHTAIEATGLTRSFGQTDALAGIDLSIARSGITAILGANGAGKTTFINCALGLLPKSGGQLSVFGGAPGSAHNRQRTGVMLQDADLPDQLSAREHLDLFASYYRDPLSVEEGLDLCALTEFSTKPYGSLSGGQKRRVQFALAVIGQPDLIFLDEPTTGLDAEARRGLWATIDNLAGQGRSIVLTTHYLEEADALADRILVFNRGRVIADGSPTEIREAVGDALIKCVTTLGAETIQRMPAVRAARLSGRYTEIISLDAAKTLTALLPADPSITDLTVSKPSLEDAFLDITKTPSQEAH